MNTKIIAAVIVVLLLLGGGALLLSQKKSTVAVMNSTSHVSVSPTIAMSPSAMKEEASPSSAMENTSGTPAVSGTQKGAVKEFTVTGSNYKFEPATLTVNKGDTVKITFKNSGGFHDFVIDEYNVKTAVIPSGQSQTVSFTADKAGTFDYYCSVGNHRQMGMQGTLTVK